MYCTELPSENDNKDGHSLGAELSLWAPNHKIKRGAASDLLMILRKYEVNYDLPKDSRTLLKTPRTTILRPVTPGHHYHFNLKSVLLDVLKLDYTNDKYKFNEIRLKIGVDGLPISDSNTSQLWPKLGCVYPTTRIFLVGVYHGYSKPADANDFLQEFVSDNLIDEGLVYNDIRFKVSPHCILADAPAKSFIMKTKCHTGYFSCTKCKQEGKYVEFELK